METVIVTRHKALIALLRERGLAGEDARVIEHASAKDVRGKHVVGVLPLHLAAMAARVTEIPLAVPQELRGQELDLDTLRRLAGPAVTYRVFREDQPLMVEGCAVCAEGDDVAHSHPLVPAW